MPVQINEVIVKATIDQKPKSGGNEPKCPPAGNAGAEAEIAEKILEILREKKER